MSSKFSVKDVSVTSCFQVDEMLASSDVLAAIGEGILGDVKY